MTIPRSLLATGTILALACTANAEPPAEAKIEHLENAARHLTEVGMIDEATRLRDHAAEIRRDLRQGQIAELAAMVEHLRQENQALQERIAQLEGQAHRGRPEPDQAAQPQPDLDQLAAEAHRKQTEQTWDAIKRAARGERPEAPEPLAPEPPIADPPAPKAPSAPDDNALLQKILESLQRIEQKMAQ